MGEDIQGKDNEFSGATTSPIPFICFFKGFSGSNHLWERNSLSITTKRKSIYVSTRCGYRRPNNNQQVQFITISEPKCAADEQWAHSGVSIGCDWGDGGAGLSDLQTEELPPLQAQVVTYLVQQNHSFILLLKETQTELLPAKTLNDS